MANNTKTVWVVTYNSEQEWTCSSKGEAIAKLYSLKGAVARPFRLAIEERASTGFEPARWA